MWMLITLLLGSQMVWLLTVYKTRYFLALHGTKNNIVLISDSSVLIIDMGAQKNCQSALLGLSIT